MKSVKLESPNLGLYVDSLGLPTFTHYYYFQLTYNLKFGDKFLRKKEKKSIYLTLIKYIYSLKILWIYTIKHILYTIFSKYIVNRRDWGLPSLILKLLPNNIQMPCFNFPIITPIYTICHMHIPAYITQHLRFIIMNTYLPVK